MDPLPPKVLIAIGSKHWSPQRNGAAIRIVRFTDTLLREGFERHAIEGVPVKVFGGAKAVVNWLNGRASEQLYGFAITIGELA
jgi:hypothetical protein